MNLDQTLVLLLIGLGLFVFTAVLSRNFGNLNLRVKVVLGILLTGGVAIGILVVFAVDRAATITSSISQRLEASVSLLAEDQLRNTAASESKNADRFFNEIKNEVERLAKYRVSLQAQRAILGQGVYWDATANLTQLEGGQYGNSPRDAASVFAPAGTILDDSILADLNTTAYLDFIIPESLKANPAILAIYYIDPKAIVRYYPNIKLATVLPPDFDATERPYYKITSPLFNPKRLTRWTIPYVDATGGGLVVTAASPVYIQDEFNGVMAADIQLSRITEQISSLKIGQTGYAFMIDDAGRIISMPPAGYTM
ncbi:MAG TPA: cache domain-containing protein, partial [Anaerolineales bacterium]|nr:cache domain-containing protein [Anaerolineales bacterium]